MTIGRSSLAWLLLAILGLIWGSSYILIKRGLEVFEPEEVATLRMLITLCCLLPFALYHVRRVEGREWKYLLIVGILGMGLPAYLFSLAQTKLSSADTGILNSLTPLFTLLIAVLFFGFRTGAMRVVGILCGLAGALLLVLGAGKAAGGGDPFYGALVAFSTLCYAYSTNIMKYRLHRLNAIQIPSLAIMLAGPFFLFLLPGSDIAPLLANDERAWSALGYISILAIGGTAVSVVLFTHLLRLSSPVFAASVTYIMPVIALGWGWLDGEQIGLPQYIGLSFILGGVYLANRRAIQAPAVEAS